MQFLNYTIKPYGQHWILWRDGIELGGYQSAQLALTDLAHRYNLQSRTEDEKVALRAFIAQQTVLAQHEGK